MNQRGFINLMVIGLVVIILGIAGYSFLTSKTRVIPASPLNNLIKTIPLPSPTPTTTSKTERQMSLQWVWENLGCGSSTPCSYHVCSVTTPKNCYFCRGKYDKLSSEGEKLPGKNENPQITANFICEPSN